MESSQNSQAGHVSAGSEVNGSTAASVLWDQAKVLAAMATRAAYIEQSRYIEGSFEESIDIEALTRTETKVLLLCEEGLTAAEIADKRGCSVETIKNHTKKIRRKLGVKSTWRAARMARLRGLL